MEAKTTDGSRGMAPSETMQKVCAIDPMGLLGDSTETGDNDQEMQELQENRSQTSEEMVSAADAADLTAHKNTHVVSESDGGDGRDSGDGSKDGRDTEAPGGDGSGQHETGTGSSTNTMGGKNPQEKNFIIVDIERRPTQGLDSATVGSLLMPPPKPKPVPTTQSAGPAPVPVTDPKNVKELFLLREKLAARLNVENNKNSAGNENSNETSGYSADSGSKSSENVLPKIKPVPAEADLIPPKTYKAIVANKKNKEKVGTFGGITSGQDPIDCGSFYNSSDNRVARSVYKEDLTSMSVTSLSFNPKNWMCTACPKSHSVVEEGGRGGGGLMADLSS
jgi:hypothetical protein